MGRLLRNILSGARQVLVISPGSEYQHPARDGFSRDLGALRKDAATVGRDMKKTVGRYGKINNG